MAPGLGGKVIHSSMPKVVNSGQKVLSHRSLEMVHQDDCRRHRRRKAEPQDGVDREPGGNVIKLMTC